MTELSSNSHASVMAPVTVASAGRRRPPRCLFSRTHENFDRVELSSWRADMRVGSRSGRRPGQTNACRHLTSGSAPRKIPPYATAGVVRGTKGRGEQLRPGRNAAARILIIEDEARIAGLLSRALASCGYEVESARDAFPPLEMLQSKRYDLVLLDFFLPGLDGFWLLHRLTDFAIPPNVLLLQRLNELAIPTDVLVLSTLSDVESKVRCFELGVSDYMTKPFSIAELLIRTRTRLRDSRDRAAARFIDDGTFRLDLRRHAVVSNGKRVDLSTREFLLLEYLMRKEGEVCTREELLASVWGYTFDPRTNVVDVYVSRLRGKLGNEVIETIRNVGYCYAVAA